MNATAISRTARIFRFIVAILALASASHLLLGLLDILFTFNQVDNLANFSTKDILLQYFYLFLSLSETVSLVFLAIYALARYGKGESAALLIIAVIILAFTDLKSFYNDTTCLFDFLASDTDCPPYQTYLLLTAVFSLLVFLMSFLATISAIRKKGSTTLAKIAYAVRAISILVHAALLALLSDNLQFSAPGFRAIFTEPDIVYIIGSITLKLPFVLFAFCCPPDRARNALPQPGYSPYQPQQNSAEQRNAALQSLQWQYQNGQITLEQYNEEYARLFYQP